MSQENDLSISDADITVNKSDGMSDAVSVAVAKPLEKAYLSIRLLRVINTREKKKELKATFQDYNDQIILENMYQKKLASDLSYIEGIFENILNEVKNSNSFHRLEEAILKGSVEQEEISNNIAQYQGRKWKEIVLEKPERLRQFKSKLARAKQKNKDLQKNIDFEVSEQKHDTEKANVCNPQLEEYEETLTQYKVNSLKQSTERKIKEINSKISEINTQMDNKRNLHEEETGNLKTCHEGIIARIEAMKNEHSNTCAPMIEANQKLHVSLTLLLAI